MDVSDKLITTIQDAVKGEEINIGGETFTTRPVFQVPELRLAAVLTTATLQSVVDYFSQGLDGVDGKAMFVHIADPSKVQVVKFLDETNRREVRLSAEYGGHTFEFGRKYDQTEFITLLRSQVVPSDARETVQKLVGSLTDESSMKLEDDGVSQRTTAKVGLATYGHIENNKPFVLAPFRTFPEVEQPESEFILRLHRRDGQAPTVSLHESDNQAWKLEAIDRIAAWLKGQDVKVPILA